MFEWGWEGNPAKSSSSVSCKNNRGCAPAQWKSVKVMIKGKPRRENTSVNSRLSNTFVHNRQLSIPMQGGPSPPVCIVSLNGTILKISNIFFSFALFALKCGFSLMNNLLSAFQQFFSLFWAFSTNSVSAVSASSKSKCCSVSFTCAKPPLSIMFLALCVWPKIVAAATYVDPVWLNSYLKLFTGTFKHSYTVLFIIYCTKREVGFKKLTLQRHFFLFALCKCQKPECCYCQHEIPLSNSAGWLTITCHSHELPLGPSDSARSCRQQKGWGAAALHL